MSVKVLTKTFIVIFALTFLFIFPSSVNAQESQDNITTRTGWGADESLTKEDDNLYNEVNKINMIVVDSNSVSIRKDCTNWTRTLYYYFTTRLGLIDLPFSYIVCQDGTILEASKFGAEKKFGLVDGSNSLNVLMLNYPTFDSLDKKSYLEKIEPFLLTKASDLSLGKIEIKELKVSLNPKQKAVTLKLNPYTKQNELSKTISETNPKIVTKKKQLKISINEVALSNKTTKGNEVVDVKVTLTNDSGFNIYGSGDNSLTLITNNPFDQKSELYGGSENWNSLSRIALLKESDILKDKEKKDFIFKIKTPLRTGTISQDFILANTLGEKLDTTNFKVQINNSIKGQEVIEILSTEIGKLNVRDNPNGKNVVTKVFPKDRFILLDRKDGYIQIDVDGTKGWIISKYAKPVTE